MGGEDKVNEWARLFLTAGRYHSFGDGPGASRYHDLYTHLIKWIDEGVGPDVLVGEHVEEGNNFSRPTFMWPYYARYKGEGNDPTSWKSFESIRRPWEWEGVNDWI